MHAFYFGGGQKRLFGAYHDPRGSSNRRSAIVICNPFGHEYIRAHRTLWTLASKLSELGFHVLRFDYYGCGDSAGSGEETNVAQYVEDIGTAIEELKAMADVERISLVGLRFGAMLAAMASAGRDDIDHLLLWAPVVSGRDFLETVEKVEALWLEGRPRLKAAARRDELLGFPLTSSQREELLGLDLRTAAQWDRATPIEVRSQEASAERLPIRWISVPVNCRWEQPSAVHSVLLAHEAVQAISDIFEKER